MRKRDVIPLAVLALVCAALWLYAIAWWLMYGPEYGFCL